VIGTENEIPGFKCLPPLAPSQPPPSGLKSQLSALINVTQALTATTTRLLDQLTALKASLLDTAFRGQL
jgi:hypothetical protein